MNTYVRWNCTQWCSYTCGYCQQDHSRKQLYRGSPGHWADNASWEAWYSAFKKHFADVGLSMLVTGGEPMLDRANVEPLLNRLADSPWVKSLEVDTNGAHAWPAVPGVKLHASWHPSQISMAGYFANVAGLRALGWRVVSAAYVAMQVGEELAQFADRCRSADLPVNVMLPYHLPVEVHGELRQYIPSKFWASRHGNDTYGMSCSFPSRAYEVDPDGTAIVGCMRQLIPAGSLFAESLPEQPKGLAGCPKHVCQCADKFVHQAHMQEADLVSPKSLYALRLREHQLG